MRTVEQLSSLPLLVNIYFKEFNESGQNPLCKEDEYRSKIFKTLIRLKSLDGLRKGHGEITFDYEVDEGEKVEYSSKGVWFS
jgi:hypothetical protein